MTARRLMVLGTGSDVGKSLFVAGLARAFTRRGLKVAPFKAQNMSNNAAVTADGGEIGRAQALQARAAGVPLSVHMNPVLLKPDSDVDAQVVVQGQVLGRFSAADYQALKPSLRGRVIESLDHLSATHDLVLIEGAGSGAERYLRPQDISNMGLAEAADLPVLLLGDESRGGVTAAVIGHHHLWTASERARVGGVIVTKFRGDPAIFAPAAADIRAETGWPVLGLMRWSEAARRLPEEDSLGLARKRGAAGALVVAVLELPRVANFDDLDPLAAEPGVDLRWVRPGQPIPAEAAVVILPGSKATRAALTALRAEGWDVDLRAHLRRGGRVVGICAGFQMLGRVVRDPEGIEGTPGETEGLGLLDLETVIGPTKRLAGIDALDYASGAGVSGYEMHMGRSFGPDLARPWLVPDGRPEGAVSVDGKVMGSYLHGLFGAAGFRGHWLAQQGITAAAQDHGARIEAALDAFAAEIEADLDLDALLDLAR
ncbi:cobyric acid synthase [Rhodobacter capsulatus]|uniref:cobyric acid synthase n=1 Tax=Rhodobacter capsulatus TaxID=1061 RepID=UPI0006DBDB11|nr:cobyric acid synthase [Rhodobacter capsulatus]KQB15397.1 cobalamin biosynthesis protein CobQ [Rhodobacter capsulatus]KQB16576.1 cobalamin biosynthesis protein CobQ [Rhodobacter capsulatus]PZX22276.1 adenosylcobyric acid synthase (glutamine-hydrolysing) [Rhodobacter capsulatus]QNR63074.1 cobyric acid synthase [Rhodobacter capsulatus]